MVAGSCSAPSAWEHKGPGFAQTEYVRLEQLGYFRCPRFSETGQPGIVSDIHACWCEGCRPSGARPARARRILEWAWRGGVTTIGRERRVQPLRAFEPHEMLRCLRGKTLFFLGDSLSFQTFESLSCLLWEAGGARQLPELSKPHVAADRRASVLLERYNVTLSYLKLFCGETSHERHCAHYGAPYAAKIRRGGRPATLADVLALRPEVRPPPGLVCARPLGSRPCLVRSCLAERSRPVCPPAADR